MGLVGGKKTRRVLAYQEGRGQRGKKGGERGSDRSRPPLNGKAGVREKKIKLKVRGKKGFLWGSREVTNYRS